jgi:protocatechuate 3,4-dioxygenase beta subunit
VGATPVGPITILTDANGYWRFDGLLPGIYTVTEADRDGWYHVSPPSVTLWVASGTHVVDVKFGNVPYTCFEVYKFEDLNGNGKWDEGERGVAGWEIRITGVRNDGVRVDIMLVTDESGMAKTCFVLLPGDYVVTEIGQQGWMPTTPASYQVSLVRCMEPSVYVFEFGNFKLGMIFGYKFEDMDGDGVKDPEDTPIEGWLIYLYPPWGGFAWTMTDENGYFEFVGLPYGWYAVEEEDRAGWKHTTPDSYLALVTSGAHVEIPVFLNYEYGCICGYKFEDLNSNGVWDEGEPAIAKWPIYMIRDALPTIYVTYTDENGKYCFSGLEADYYIVYEIVPSDWVATTPTSYMVVITSGVHERLPDFGNFHKVMLTLFKFEDVWGDGEYDDADHGIGGWAITVTGPGVPGGSVTVYTDEFGYAYVWVAAAGTYTVTEEDRDGWCHTTSPVVYVDVMSGHAWPSAYVEFGNFECVDITIFKFEDVDGDGVYDPRIDEPIEGWLIYAWEYYTGELRYLYTDEDGLIHLRFCEGGLWSFGEWYVSGWRQTLPEEGDYNVLVTSGMALNTVTQEEQYYFEFGNFQCVEILIFKYWDTCSNGWYDPEVGDVPLERWYFALYMVTDDGWVLVDEGFSGPDGKLEFRVCAAGTYVVVEEDRSGWSYITPLSGQYEFEVRSGDVVELWFGNYLDVEIPVFKYEDVNSNGVYDDGDRPIEGWYFELEHVNGAPVYSGYTDENGKLILVVNRSGIYTLTEEDRDGWTHVNPAGGVRLVNVVSGTQVPLQMFGNFKDVEIVVFKFDDIYADGQYCPGEGDVPIEGWLIDLYYETSPGVWILVDSQLTGPDGYAKFVVNKSGHYKVVEEARAGWWWILPRSGMYDFWVYSSDVIRPFEFANFKMGMIYGYKWNDLNGNGMWDAGEPPLAGWTISFETLEGFYMFGTMTTDQNGYYEFTGLPPGLYEVWENVEPGWTPTSDPSVVVEIWGHREVRVDFLNFELGCIEGYKYEDVNGNGVYDDGDRPIEGWWIYLAITGWRETPDGMISFITLIAWVQTDADGHYMFCGLGPGTYVVSEESRTGWIHTTPDSETVFMTSGAHLVIHDFLNFKLGCICGYKFDDSNSNGIWDEGEDPISGWPIYMVRDALPTIYVTYTDENGKYCFRNLEADYYIVYEVVPAGWAATTLTSYMVVIESGDRELLPDFGNFKCVKIPIFKYEDVNGNGVFDNGDRPIAGWTFTVSGPAFDAPLVVVTDKYGWANVTVCVAGEYTVTEEDRAGWTHVNPKDGYLKVTVSSGDALRPLRFGNFELGVLILIKYYDWDMDGQLDEGEVGLPNWVIWLNGTLVGGGYLNMTRLTDSNGEVRFDGLPAGTYIVSERLEYAPPGWQPTTPWIVSVDITSGSQSRILMGNVLLGEIWGYKFYDKDLDGVMDEDEPGLEGWRIVLDGVDDMGMPVHMETWTNGAGYYMFPGLHPGVYWVSEIIPPTWEATTDLPVEVDVSGAQEEFVRQVNIGNIQYAVIWGYKFLDTYEDSYPFWPNGLFDGDEYGLGNWKITLQGRDINGNLVSMVQYTDNMGDVGYYAFTGLLPGTYWVNETLLWGYYATRPVANLVMVYPFPMGPVVIRIDFGNLVPSVDPELNFVLHKGWNLWSTPLLVKGGLTAKGLLAAIGPAGVMVTKLDTASQKWVSYVFEDPDKFDFAIELGKGYYVWVSSYTVFQLRGDLVLDSTSPLSKGWNIMGYSSLEPIMASEALNMVSGTTAWMITYLDAETGKYISYVKGDPAKFDFVVTPGRAYFIWVEGPGSMVY